MLQLYSSKHSGKMEGGRERDRQRKEEDDRQKEQRAGRREGGVVLHPSFSSSFGRTVGNSDPIYPDLLTPVRHLLMECVNVFVCGTTALVVSHAVLCQT